MHYRLITPFSCSRAVQKYPTTNPIQAKTPSNIGPQMESETPKGIERTPPSAASRKQLPRDLQQTSQTARISSNMFFIDELFYDFPSNRSLKRNTLYPQPLLACFTPEVSIAPVRSGTSIHKPHTDLQKALTHRAIPRVPIQHGNSQKTYSVHYVFSGWIPSRTAPAVKGISHPARGFTYAVPRFERCDRSFWSVISPRSLYPGTIGNSDPGPAIG